MRLDRLVLSKLTAKLSPRLEPAALTLPDCFFDQYAREGSRFLHLHDASAGIGLQE
jgi:hypothetical protein